MEVRNLNQILGGRDYDALDAKAQKEYQKVFAAFKAEHTEKYPEGETIKLAVNNLSLRPNSDGVYRIEVKSSANTFTPIFKFKDGNLRVMLVNSLNLTPAVALPTILACLDKGYLQMVVRVVDETDTYVSTDGTTGNFSRPGVQILGNIHYIASKNVELEVSKVLREYQRIAIANELTATQTPAVPAGLANDASDDDTSVF